MNKTSKVLVTMACAVSLFGVSANAEIIKLAEVGVNPAAIANISGAANGSFWAGQTQLQTADGKIINAFCVDPQLSISGLVDYTIITPTGKYAKAAWLWDNMGTYGNDVVATQLAIWEATWDNGDPTEINSGNFQLNSLSNNYSTTTAIRMLTDLKTANLSTFNTDGYRVVISSKSQDFLVKTASVPEPSTMLLMFMGLACLAGCRRKKQK